MREGALNVGVELGSPSRDAQRPAGELVADTHRPGGFLAVPAVHLLVTAAGQLEVVGHTFQTALRSAGHVTSSVVPSSLTGFLERKLARSTFRLSRRVERLQQLNKDSINGRHRRRRSSLR